MAANCGDVFGGGTVSYDPGTHTLTLTNYTYSGEGAICDDSMYACIVYKRIPWTSEPLEPLTLKLVGSNALTYSRDALNGRGMYISSDLTLEGDGSLTVTDAGTLYEEYPDVQHTSYGIYVNGSLTVNGGTVSAASHGLTTANLSPFSTGVYCYGKLTVNGGSLTGHGGKVTFTEDLSSNDTAYGDGCGIIGFEGIEINGGSLTASSAGIDGNGPQKFSSQAVNAAPTYPSTFTATASTDASGAGAETFDSSKLSS